MNDGRLAALNALLKEALALYEPGVGTLARAVMTFLSERAKEPGAEPLAQVLAQATSEVSDQADAGWKGVAQTQAQFVELFDQSRWALSQGLWRPAQIGFQIMESLLSSVAEQSSRCCLTRSTSRR